MSNPDNPELRNGGSTDDTDAKNDKPIYGERKRKFNDVRKRKYLKLLADKGMGLVAAAHAVGVNISTVEAHRNEQPEFDEAVTHAQMDANGKVQNALYKGAIEGNTTAAQVWLYNRDPNNWRDKRNIGLEGPGGGPIEVTWNQILRESIQEDEKNESA